MKSVVVVVAGLALLHCHPDPSPRHPAAAVATTTAPAGALDASVPPVPPIARDVSRPDARGTLAGTIRDAAGKSIAGAHACARIDDDVWHVPVCVATDAQGAYLIEVPTGRYIVDAMANGRMPAPFRHGTDAVLFVGAGTQQHGLDIALGDGAAEVTGTVTDPSGAPAGDVLVGARLAWSRHPTAFTRTDAAGHYSLWMRGDLRIVVLAEGYAGGERGTAPGVVDVKLERAPAIAGRVIEAGTGAAIAGIRVEAMASGMSLRDATTDAQGRFRIGGLWLGRFEVVVRDARLHSVPAPSVVVRAGEAAPEVTVVVRPAARVSGQIVDAETNQPCVSGTVALTDPDGLAYRAEADPMGAVAFDAIPAGVYQASVYCLDHLDGASYPPLTVADTDLANLTWPVAAGGAVTGHIRARSGAPVAGEWIVAHLADSIMGTGHATSAADGAFRISGLPPGTYRLSLYNDLAIAIGPTEVELRGPSAQKDIIVTPGMTLRGVVVDEHGTPLPRIEVQLQTDDHDVLYMRNPKRLTAPDGTFAFVALPPAEYRVAVHAVWGSDELPLPSGTVTLRAGKQPTPLRLVLSQPTGTIRGTVVDARGAPVRDAEVGSLSTDTTHTAADGTFVLAHVAPGSRMVIATRDQIIYATAKDVGPGATIALQLPDPAAIEGTVTLAEGGPVPDELWFEVSEGSGSRKERFTSSNGHFALRFLTPGHVKVVAHAGAATGTLALDLAAGAIQRGVAIVLAPAPVP